MNAHERIDEKRLKRITEFSDMDIIADRGEWNGYIQFSASSAEEILRRLRRLKKFEQATA